MSEINKIKVGSTEYDIRDTSKYTKPATGIPASDLASGVVPSVVQATGTSITDVMSQKAVTNITNDMKDNIALSQTSGKWHLDSSLFVNGTINYNSGKIVKDAYLYRIVIDDIQYAEENITISSVDDNFNLHIYAYSSSSEDDYIGAIYSSIIPKGTYYRVVIYRKVEDASEIADISDFSKKVVIYTFTEASVMALENSNKIGILSCNPTYYPVPIQFNSTAHTCIINAGNIIANQNIDGKLTTSVTLTLSAQNGIILVNPETGAVTAVDRTATISSKLIILAVYANYGSQVSCPTYFTIDGYPYGINVTPTLTKYPSYEYTALQNATLWSDFCFINNELWAFCPSGDETHTSANGYIQIYNPTTGAISKSFTHNLGHCNTVHYNATNDKLLIGNLPGNTSYPSAIYIFDDVSDWNDKASGSTIDFSTESHTIVDFSALGNGAKQTVACWGENNMSKNDIIYMSGNFNTDWYKIQLGMGSNNLGSGTFASTDDDKFNGSYSVIWHKTFALKYGSNQEVIQGIDYENGTIWTSNGHNELQWWQWKFISTGMDREENNTVPYKADGTVNYCISEGFCIKDGYAYVGCIFTDSTHTTVTGELGFIKVKI